MLAGAQQAHAEWDAPLSRRRQWQGARGAGLTFHDLVVREVKIDEEEEMKGGDDGADDQLLRAAGGPRHQHRNLTTRSSDHGYIFTLILGSEVTKVSGKRYQTQSLTKG